MYHKVIRYMEQFHMTEHVRGIVVGLSGGADSMCLLDLMHRYCTEQGICLQVVHVNHGIRGDEALRDESFCKDYCETHGMECKVIRYDVPEYAQTYGLSIEEAGRLLRYEALQQEAGKLRKSLPFMEALQQDAEATVAIAVAHHRDDQAETVLFHMCRGTDIRGLRGMLPVNGDVIRPLLCMNKQDILSYCVKEKLPYVTDSTNGEISYTRNRIRREVMPILEEKVNPQASEHLAKLGERVGMVEDYLASVTDQMYQLHAQEETDGEVLTGIFLTGLDELHPYIANRVLYKAVTILLGRAKDLTMEHVERMKHLLSPDTGVGTVEDVREGVIARKEQDGIYLTQRSLLESEEGTAKEGELSFTVIDCEDMKACAEAGLDPEHPTMSPRILRNDDYTKFFDYDKINNGLRLRHREEGDYLIVDDSGHEKSLHRYFIDAKIPLRMRDRVWVLADDHHIVWIVGGRISAGVKVTSQTRKILKVDYIV